MFSFGVPNTIYQMKFITIAHYDSSSSCPSSFLQCYFSFLYDITSSFCFYSKTSYLLSSFLGHRKTIGLNGDRGNWVRADPPPLSMPHYIVPENQFVCLLTLRYCPVTDSQHTKEPCNCLQCSGPLLLHFQEHWLRVVQQYQKQHLFFCQHPEAEQRLLRLYWLKLGLSPSSVSFGIPLGELVA